MSSPKTMLVATVKNEGPNILEWVAHHLLIGFDRIHIYQNDSTDETAKHLRTLQRIGAIEYVPNDSAHRDWQNRAYRRASRSDSYRDSDWCMALDGDEFLNVHSGGVQDLIAACDGADEIVVNWRQFGSSGHRDLSDRLVVERFTMAEAGDLVVRHVRGVKSLFRTRAFKRPGIHRAKIPLVDPIRVKNGSGLDESAFTTTNWRCTDPGACRFAQVNHYAVRDASSFLLKSARGSSSHPDRAVQMKYWKGFNTNIEADRRLALQAPRIWDKMRELDDLSGGRLFFLRRNSLRLWQERLEHLLASPAERALFDEITDLSPAQSQHQPA